MTKVSSELVQNPLGILHYPRVGETWKHIKTGFVVQIFGLHIVWADYKDGEKIWLRFFPEPSACTAKSDIKASDQCVIYTGSQQSFVREIGNFLERFERISEG